MISPIPSGGSRLAWVSGDNNVHIAQLGADDQLVGTPLTLPAHDFSDVDVHLLHFTTGAPDKDLIISADATLNNRSNHLAKYGSSRLLSAWETASAPNDFTTRTAGRKFYVQTQSAATGEAEGGPYEVALTGNRYHEFRDYPDGSIAYPTAGSTSTKIKILRVLPCN